MGQIMLVKYTFGQQRIHDDVDNWDSYNKSVYLTCICLYVLIFHQRQEDSSSVMLIEFETYLHK